MNRISRNLKIALRAESVIARRRLAVFRAQTGLMAFAGLVAGLGIIMLNVGGFLLLAEHVDRPIAAFIVAGVNLALALALILFALRINVEQELAPMVELRDMAIEDVERDIVAGSSDLQAATKMLRKIARDPLGSVAPSLIGPLIDLLMKAFKKDQS